MKVKLVSILTEARLVNRKRAAYGTLTFSLTAFSKASFDTVTDLGNRPRSSLLSIICRKEHNKFVVKNYIVYQF